MKEYKVAEIILSTYKPRIVKKMITILKLANNYHSIDDSDIQDNIKELLLEEIYSEFAKHLQSYQKRGHTRYLDICQILTADDALEFAQCSFIDAWK
ncbi:hypothetical protein [Aquamicrobium sp.]|uniref:hypothetical protein n=1 Tax=Aquamicrobium sp. TaxID=1872579 RepID=UPI00258D8EDB|nr:hypothetical protein [Aquamicrobium sp.]MCK9549301.1 hypothetical protein [Aquamicrobium sp.]